MKSQTWSQKSEWDISMIVERDRLQRRNFKGAGLDGPQGDRCWAAADPEAPLSRIAATET